MAALGAAAGAFQGDMEREAAAARRAQLGLQAQRMNQDAQNFNILMRAREADKAEYARQREEERRERFADKERAQANYDRMFALQERKFGQDVQNTAFEQQRLGKQDAWADALNEQKIRENEEAIAFQKERFAQFKTLAEQERQTIAERKRLAQTALASAMKIGMESGGVVPLSVVQAVAKETGIPFQGMYFAPDGSFVTDVLKDGKVVQEVTPANVQAAIMRSMPGVFGEEAAKDLLTERRERARYDNYGHSKAGAEKLSEAGKMLLNIKLGRIERERSAILKELAPEDAKVMLGDKEYQKRKDRLMQLDQDEEAAIYSAYGENIPAPSGAGAAPAGQSPKNSAVRDKDKLVVTINGQTARMPDTPKNRAMLQEKYNIQIGGDKAATPEASGAPAPQSATASTGQIPVVEQPPVAEKLTAEQARRRQNAVASTEKAGGSAPASQPATKNVGKQKSWTTPSSTPLFEAGADGKRGKANVEPGKDTQRLGRNKPPAAVELRFTKQQEESLTDEDRRAIAKIHADSLKLEEDPVTGLVPDREAYRKQKVMEYFQQKFETEFERLFGEGKFETEFKRRFGVAPK